MDPNNQAHWDYLNRNKSWISGTDTTPDTNQSPVRQLKRSLSESDDYDAYSEESSKEPCSTTANSDSCQMLTRKKRRGIIEKKRRDRINTSLTELKRLVPSVYEKQGSAKLEKAEILQMTVDYLKILNNKEVHNGNIYDAQKPIIDYHTIGFKECVNEVSRYLVTVEGMDLDDPVRLRLMSHLQCLAAQRGSTNKENPLSSSTSANPFSYSPAATQPYHHPLTPNLNPVSSSHSAPTIAPPINIHDTGNNYLDISASCTFTLNTQNVLNKTRQVQLPHTQPPIPAPHPQHLQHNHNNSANNPHAFILAPNLTPLAPVSAHQYNQHFNSYQNFASSNSSQNQNFLSQNNNNNNSNNSAQMKPYRPWGGPELAY